MAFEVEPGTDPLALFQTWLNDAVRSELNDPNAMSLATCTPDGVPSVRMVLLKGVDERGFQFFTNRESQKGRELRANPRAALCFHWKSVRRQVRVEGAVTELPPADVDAYFQTRARLSRIGAWASQQSRPLASLQELTDRAAEFDARFPGDVPRPPYWTGFAVQPDRIEFWQDGAFRLHDRFSFERPGDGTWVSRRLSP